MTDEEKDWKLKLRYGRLSSPYKHFSVLADGIVGKLEDGFECRPGRAWMGMKTWATDADESADMAKAIGKQIGFTVSGDIQIYVTEPERPPGEKPYGYDIRFTPYDEIPNKR